MKTLLITLFALFTACSQLFALSLQWDSNPGAENVTQYKIYRVKTHGASLVGTVASPTTTFNVDNYLSGNRTTFYVTAVNVVGEGPASSRVTVQRH
jgi:fibronectin type 3 domain-containing protein